MYRVNKKNDISRILADFVIFLFQYSWLPKYFCKFKYFADFFQFSKGFKKNSQLVDKWINFHIILQDTFLPK